MGDEGGVLLKDHTGRHIKMLIMVVPFRSLVDMFRSIANKNIGNDNNRTYICEFAYSAEKGVFSSMMGADKLPSNSQCFHILDFSYS